MSMETRYIKIKQVIVGWVNCFKIANMVKFANCPQVTSFASTFYNCSNLTGSIPENLFANNPNVTSFFVYIL